MPKLKLEFFVSGDEIKELEKTPPVICTFKNKGEYYTFVGDGGKEKEGFKISIELPNKEIKFWSPNMTSQKTIAKKYGEDSDDWEGKQIELYTTFQKVFKEDKNVIYARIPDSGEPEKIKPEKVDHT